MCHKIFLCRNAGYNPHAVGRHLTDNGEKQARDLASRIKENLGSDENLDLTIWTSESPRAKETAEIIRSNFPKAKFVAHKKLWSSKSDRPDIDWLLRKMQSFKGKNLIIVTHLEFVRDILSKLGSEYTSARYAECFLKEKNTVSKI